jgi:hypothetical protein
VEGEFIIAPTPAGCSTSTRDYLKTRVKDLSLVDVRDPSAAGPTR